MSDGARQLRPLRGLPAAGGAVGVLVAVALGVAGLSWPDALLLAVLIAVLPALAVAQLALMPPGGLERVSAYLSSIVSLTVLGGISFVAGTRGRGTVGLGLAWTGVGEVARWTLALIVLAVSVIALFRFLSLRIGYRESPIVTQLLPRTPRERALFTGLSLAAGVGEEIAYRGFFLAALGPLTGAGVAALLGSAVFGILHVYQGWMGMLRAACLGGLFAWGFLASGMLWPAILAHFAVDVLAGIVLRDWLIGRTRDEESATGTVASSGHPTRDLK